MQTSQTILTDQHSDNLLPDGFFQRSLLMWMIAVWIALFIIRPWEYVFPELNAFRLERTYALAVIAVALLSGGLRFPICQQTIGLLVLLFAFVASMLGAAHTELAWEKIYIFLTYIAFFFLLLSAVRTPNDLLFVVTAYIVVMGVYLGKAEWEYFVHGRHHYSMGVSRLIGIDVTFGAPNSVASATAVSLPFVRFLWDARPAITCSWPQRQRKWFALGLIAYFGMAVTAIVLTNSRSGMLQFVFFLVFFGTGLQHSRKKTTAALIALLVLVAIWSLMPEESKGRLRTVWDAEAGPASASGSADERYTSIIIGWAMLSDSPLTGVGIGNFKPYRMEHLDGSPTVAHSLYGQVPGETGLIGIGAFLFFISGIFANARVTKTLSRQYSHPIITQLSYLAATCRFALLLLLVASFGGGSLYRFQWVWIAAFALLCREQCQAIADEEEEKVHLDHAQPTAAWE